MANVRCPMCSKVNTPDAEACVYCGARLKPVRPPSAPAHEQKPQAAAAQPGDEPDWLRQIRQDAPVSSTPPGAPSGAPASPSQAEEAEEVPDWLSRIRSRERDEEGEGAFSSAGAASGQPGGEADWLRGLQGDQPEIGGTAEEPSGQFDLGDDWLNRLQGQQDTPSAAEAESGAPAFDSPDWLQSFSGQPAEETGTGQDFSGWMSESAASGQDFPGWMSESSGTDQGFAGWGSEAPSAGEAAGPAAQPAGDDDWMSKLSSWETAPSAEEEQPAFDWGAPEQQPAAPTSTDADDLGWLNTLGFDAGQPPAAEAQGWPPVEEAAPEPEPEPRGQSSGFGLTGFLANLEQEEPGQPTGTAAPAAEPEGGDWFNRFNEPASASFAETLPAETAEPGIPEWLRGGEEETAPAAEEPSAGESLPAWLSGDFDAAEAPAAAGAEPSLDAGLPAWLAGEQEMPFAQEEPGPGAAQPQAGEAFDFPGAAASEALPAWLSSEEAAEPFQPAETQPGESKPAAAFDFSAAEEETPFAEAPAAQGEEGMPDWFSSFSQAEESEAQPAPAVEDTQPTWLSGVNVYSSGEENPPAEAPEPAAAPFIDENVPDWLRDFNTQQPSDAEGAVPPLIGAEEPAISMQEDDQPFLVDLPDWLAEDSAAQQAEGQDQAALLADEEQLARAELPEWVKDMRPIESVIPGEAPAAEVDQRVEKAGPLAGVPGILPAEEMVSHYRKLPVYSVKLRVTEKQRSHAALLDSILAQETQPVAIPPQRSHAPRILLHILIALLLLFALTAPRILQMDALAAPAAQPGLAPDELQDMFETIDGQVSQDSAPVLVAVDYEPGLSGEMRLAAAPVIDHLMARNARIVVVSTIPSGPALAQRLLTEAAQNHAGYNLEEQTVNLGYLPGGAISLVEFARQPQLAAPVTFYGDPAWQRPALSQVSGLQSFAQVIVLTDSPETGRAWVEQVQPAMGAVPLLLVSSAQAAPMLEPFVQSGQVQGMVSGVLGGLMYAQQAGQANNPVTPHFASYQVGVLLAFVLVLLGGLISGARAAFSRGGRDKEEE